MKKSLTNKSARRREEVSSATLIRPAAGSETVDQDILAQEFFANEPRGFFTFGKANTLWALAAKCTAVLILFLTITANAAVHEVGSIGLTVRDINRSLDFFTNVLAFEKTFDTEIQGADYERLHGVFGARVRVVGLKLGEESITLTEYIASPGKDIPADSRSYDHWFQHIAIVVRDMDAAYARLRKFNVHHVSTGPQRLPDWNKAAGGIEAFYFRDPDNHVLEIIHFPAGKGNPRWQQSTDKLFLGIDHTAIVVADTKKSLEFYRDVLGFKIAGESENYGTEQEHLNNVLGARLHITALRAEKGPGIEFLEYLSPAGGRDLPPDAQANDLLFWNTTLEVDTLDTLTPALRDHKSRFISSSIVMRPTPSLIIRDPDGHALQFVAPVSHNQN